MSEPKHILIVDDAANVRLLFGMTLEAAGYRFSTAQDGEEALLWLHGSDADLVLLDLQMPRLGGMEVLEAIRHSGNDVPVVIITAQGSVPDAVRAMKLGAIDFLAKPLTPEALRKVVSEVMARHDDEAAERRTESTKPLHHHTLQSAKRALNHRLFFRAKALLRQAIQEDPDSAEPRFLMGVLHEVQDEHRAAVAEYRVALRLDPGFGPATSHLETLKDRSRA